MKNCIVLTCLLNFTVVVLAQQTPQTEKNVPANLFIITTDGFRWQEVFDGADSTLINNEKYTPDTVTVKSMYWSDDGANVRRKKLLPFFWNVIAAKGQLYGNRNFNNNMNVANLYAFSYPGYNELLTGTTDLRIYSNDKKLNPNVNLLEWLDRQETFQGKVAAFTSWDVFPYILNKKRNDLELNSGYENINGDSLTENETKINAVQSISGHETSTRNDRLTFIAAKEYAEKNRPRVLFIGLGETDEYAHHSRYDLYLQKAADVDHMIGELWHWVQTTPGYKDNTVFLITTDHGRGVSASTWNIHGPLTKGSSQTWMACIGPGIDAIGEVKTDDQNYTKQLSTTFAKLLGTEFRSNNKLIGSVAGKE